MATHTEPLGSAEVERELARLRLHAPKVLQTGRGHRAFFRWIAGIALVAVAALFLPWQQSVQGTGVVTALRPQDRPQVLPAAIDGQIRAWHVREGEFVRKGQLIARISEVKEEYLDSNLVQRTAEQRDATTASIEEKRRAAASLDAQVAVLERAMTLKLEQTRNRIRQYEADVRAAEVDSSQKLDQLARREALYRDGLVDLNSLQSFRLSAQKAAADLAAKRAELSNARVDLSAVAAEYQKEIVKAQSDRAKTLADANTDAAEVAKLASKVTSLEVRRGFYEIRAPQDGYVVRAMRAYPELLRGPVAADALAIRALDGWVAKGGAEGLFCAGSADGLGVALKVEDGAFRAIRPALAAFLARLGVETGDLGIVNLDNSRGERVGEVIVRA